MKKRALLLGASGLIGSASLPILQKEYDVIQACRGQPIKDSACLDIDIAKPETFPNIPIDVVINCAARLAGDAFELQRVNCQGLINSVNWAMTAGCRKFVHLSSIQVIGKPLVTPIDENHPLNPLSFYHLTKLFGEKFLLLPEYQNLNPVILRVPSPLGPGMNPRSIIPVFLRNAQTGNDIVLYGNGSRKQNYMDVEDIAYAIIKAVSTPHTGIYNLSGQRPLSNLEAAYLCRQICASSSEIVFSGVPDAEEGDAWEIDASKIARQMDFTPKYSFQDSLRKLLECNENFIF